jgi:hypothetical protein
MGSRFETVAGISMLSWFVSIARALEHRISIRVSLVLYALAITGISTSALANHPEDSCPDTHVDGGQSVAGKIYNDTTGEIYADGSQVPIGTQLRQSGQATAFGYCKTYVWS